LALAQLFVILLYKMISFIEGAKKEEDLRRVGWGKLSAK
jgi:hypothetical protein